ncbi:MAG: ABC transporter, permease protein (cluster 3, basic aa/glutamine/opines), partial [uncultured Pseudonocardia sp.]
GSDPSPPRPARARCAVRHRRGGRAGPGLHGRLGDHPAAVLRPRGRCRALPGRHRHRPAEHRRLHDAGVPARPGARAAPRPDAAVGGPHLPLGGRRVHRVLPGAPRAAGRDRHRVRHPAGLPDPVGPHPPDRGGPGPRRLGLHRRDDPRRYPGGAQGAGGGGPVAGDVPGADDGVHRDPAGVPDHPAAADQRAHPAHQGLLAGVPAGHDGRPVRARPVRPGRAQPGAERHAAGRRGALLPDHHAPAVVPRPAPGAALRQRGPAEGGGGV